MILRILTAVVTIYSGTAFCETDREASNAKQRQDLLEGRQMLEMTAEVSAALEGCEKKFPNNKVANKAHSECIIYAAHPLVPEGNYMAAIVIAKTYEDLGYHQETQKWIQYIATMPNLPTDLKAEVIKKIEISK